MVAAAAALGAAAQAAAGPPLPTSSNANVVQLVASGLKTPTSFAFGDGSVFEGDGGNAKKGPPNGGLFVLKNGTGVRLAGSPEFVGGLVWRGGTLYMSGGTVTGPKSAKFQLLAWSGWNGTAFAHHRVLYTAPKGFEGFNGLGFGANGRLYVGVDPGLLNNNDHGPASLSPYLYDILSIKPNGTGLRVVATGIRQPWQFAFPKGSNSPFVTDFGQDSHAKNPPDFLLRVVQGQNYGFPKCNWTSKSACAGYAKPFQFFAPHTDIGGLAIYGGRIYISEFGFVRKPAVVSIPMSGGTPKNLLTGFAAPVVGLGESGGYLYVGSLSGQIYRVKL